MGSQFFIPQTAEAQFVVPAITQTFVVGDYSDIKSGTYGGECVLWLKKYLNTEKTAPTFRGTAKDIAPTSQTAQVGSIVLLAEGAEGHTALVIALDDEGDHYGTHSICAQMDSVEIVALLEYVKSTLLAQMRGGD